MNPETVLYDLWGDVHSIAQRLTNLALACARDGHTDLAFAAMRRAVILHDLWVEHDPTR